MAKLTPIALAWLNTLPLERQDAAEKLINTIQQHLPKGFSCEKQNNMLAWVVPLTLFPQGYHCSPNTPLPFLYIASQKNALTLYHMGIYAEPELLAWFTNTWPEHTQQKLDMGKSCIRFKKPDQIPFVLLGELCEKMTPTAWIETYTKAFRK